MKAIQVKIACILMVFFIVQAMLLGSVCISAKGCSASSERVLVSLDVCGHGGPSGVVSVTDIDAAALPFVPQICAIESTGFPPTPGKAVASVDPRETGKPPEPSLS